MRPECCWPLLFLLLATAAEAAELQRLQHNPFRQPEVVNEPPPPPVQPETHVHDEPELELSATMLSEVSPMVVVNGELLGIGDEIDELRLVAVYEGRAVFVRHGKIYRFELKQLQPK